MRIKLLILFVFISLSGFSQNLVMNPSFEDTIPCNQVNYPPSFSCYPWFLATSGNVDYFSETNQCWSYSAPESVFGFQYARTGVAYCGLLIYENIPQFYNYREYLEGILYDTLQTGHTYCVSFYVVNGNFNRYYSASIGVYFSTDSVYDQSTIYNLSYVPQIINTNGIIYHTLNWTQISGTFVAGGGEKFITIGNFNDDANTVLDSNTYANQPAVYFYIDDVSVVDCTVGINEIESYKNKISLMPNPARDELRIMSDELRIKNIEVCDVLNNVVFVEGAEAIEKNIKINVSNFAKGVYFVKVFSDKGIAIKKFIKE